LTIDQILGWTRWRARRFVRVITAVTVATVAAGVAVLAGTTPAGAAPPHLIFLNEPFTGPQVQIPSNWVVPALPSGTPGSNVACMTASLLTAQTPIPGCQNPAIDAAPNGALRLTSAAGSLDGGTSFARTVPSAQGLDIRFNTYQYGGNGADGILFYLAGSDPTYPAPPTALGPPGGHLGYSGGSGAPTGNGLANGYLGIGFDVYGNFTNSNFNGSGCVNPAWVGAATKVAGQVTVRGPGSGTVGYCPMASSAAAGGLSGKLGGNSSATRSGSLVPVEIAINPTAAAVGTSGIASVPAYSYVVSVSPLGGPTQIITGSLPNASSFEPAPWLEPSRGIPYQLAMGFAASTGGSTDVHEVRNIAVQPLFSNPAQVAVQLTDTGSGALVQGTPVTYTAAGSLSVGGGSLNQPASLIATLPTGVVPGTASGTDWSCVTAGQTVTCAYTGTLPIPSGTALPPVSIPANVSPGASGPVSATAQIVSDNAQLDIATDAGTINAAAAVGPILGVALSDNVAGSFTQGGTATFNVQASVSSGGSAEGHIVSVTDTLPAGIVPGTASGTSWSCTTVVQTVTCTWAGTLPIAPGTVLPAISVPVSVSAAASGGVATTVTLTSSDAATANATDYGSVTSIPAYGLTLTDSSGGNIPANGTFTYTSTPSLSASGGTETLDPTVTQALAPGVTASAASGTGWTCTLLSLNRVVSCDFSGAIPAPGSSFPAITISAATTLGSGNISSSATVTSPDGLSASATDRANVAAPPPPLLAVQASGPSLVYAGTSFPLTISPSIASGTGNSSPVVTAVLAAGETFPSSATTQSGYNCARSTTTVANDTLTCTSTIAPPIGSGSLGAIVATVVLAPATTGSPAVSVKLADAGDNATPAIAGTAPTIVPLPVLAVAVGVTPSGPTFGSTVQVNVQPSLTSAGGPAMSAPSVAISAPSGATFPSAPTSSGYSCIRNSATLVTCDYQGSLPVTPGTSLPPVAANATIGAIGSLQFVVKFSDAADGAIPALAPGTVVAVQAPQTITPSTPPSSVTVGSPTYTPSGSGGSSGNSVVVTLDLLSTGCTLTGGVVAFIAPGTCILNFDQAGNANYSAAPQVQQTIVIGKASQTISFTPPATGTVGGGTTLSATGGASGNPVTFTVDPSSTLGSCSLSGAVLSYAAVGNCVIDANQAGNANYSAAAQVQQTVVIVAQPLAGEGYRLPASDGGVFAFGADSFLGSLVSRGVRPSAPIAGMAANRSGNGYWLVGQDGSIYTFGDAKSYGTPASAHVSLNEPIVGMAATPDGRGYWEVASDGGVFAFGDAAFEGNTYTIGIQRRLDQPIKGMAISPDGKGYWLVAGDGGVFAFGNAVFAGNTYTIGIEHQLAAQVVGMAASPAGKGYWLVAGDGGVFAFGDALFLGNTYTTGIERQLTKPMVGMAATPDGNGYWLAAADGGVFAYGDAQFLGNTYTVGIENQLNGPMTGLTEAP